MFLSLGFIPVVLSAILGRGRGTVNLRQGLDYAKNIFKKQIARKWIIENHGLEQHLC